MQNAATMSGDKGVSVWTKNGTEIDKSAHMLLQEHVKIGLNGDAAAEIWNWCLHMSVRIATLWNRRRTYPYDRLVILEGVNCDL